MKFELINGNIMFLLEDRYYDVTKDVMPVVDDYLDYKLGLTSKPEMIRSVANDIIKR